MMASYRAVLERQVGLLRQLDALARGQRALIDAEDPEPLLACMHERQRLVDDLTALSQEGEALRARMMSRGGTGAHEPADIVQLLESLAAMARTIMQRDGQDQERLRARRDAASKELTELTGARKAMHAYAGRPATPESGIETSMFQDRRG